jgi:glucosamine kinase
MAPSLPADPGPHARGRFVVGIDAGGTKTVGLLADEKGEVVSEARAGGANLQTHGELQVEKVLHGVIESLVTREPVSAVCLGIAGVDRPSDENLIRGILRRLGYREAVRVVNDAVIALVAGAPERSGIVLLAGTGSIAYGEHPSGRSARAGGYGYFLADEGSAYWLGHEALRAVVRAADSRGPETQLAALVFRALDAASVPDLVPIVYEKGLQRTEVARLAGLVQQAAESGDAEANRILRRRALSRRPRGGRLPGLSRPRAAHPRGTRVAGGGAGAAGEGAGARGRHPRPRPAEDLS